MIKNMPLLNNLKVLDFTTFLSGPFATQILGDLGAEVIKIETSKGDGTRHIPPYFVGDDSAYYLSTNRNKKSIALNLKSTSGQEIIRKLIEQADVIVENFRPGVSERLGIDFETVKKINPKIIYCSITGFGQEGPYRNKPAYDMIVQAISGTMSITGEKGGDPVRIGPPIGDLVAGLYADIGILAAIIENKESSVAKYIDISMLDSQLSMLSYLGVYYLTSGDIPGTQGREHASIPTYRALKSKDNKYIVITANTQKMFEGICKVINREELIEDERFQNGKSRLDNKEEFIVILKEEFFKFSSKELLKLLEENEVPCAPLNNVEGALNDIQIKERNMVISLNHQQGEEFKLIGNPIKVDGVQDNYQSPPLLNEHAEDILMDIGYSEKEIKELLSEM